MAHFYENTQEIHQKEFDIMITLPVGGSIEIILTHLAGKTGTKICRFLSL